MNLPIKQSYVGYDKYIQGMVDKYSNGEPITQMYKISDRLAVTPITDLAMEFQDRIIENKKAMQLNMHKGRDENISDEELDELNKQWATLVKKETLLFKTLAYLDQQSLL